MQSVTIDQLSEHLREYLTAVERGESIDVRDGATVVARLVPAEASAATSVDPASDLERRRAKLQQLIRESARSYDIIPATKKWSEIGPLPDIQVLKEIDIVALIREDRDASG